MILLETRNEMTFNDNVSDVFHGLIRNTNRYLHCELVTWYLNSEGNKWIKTRIFVDPELTECEFPYIFCIKVLSKGKTPINPCVYPINIGAPLMCDVSLEGIFFGEGRANCTNPQTNSVNKALILEKRLNVTDWLYGTTLGQKLPTDQLDIDYDWQLKSNFAENDMDLSDKEDDMIVLNHMIYYRKKCSGGQI